MFIGPIAYMFTLTGIFLFSYGITFYTKLTIWVSAVIAILLVSGFIWIRIKDSKIEKKKIEKERKRKENERIMNMLTPTHVELINLIQETSSRGIELMNGSLWAEQKHELQRIQSEELPRLLQTYSELEEEERKEQEQILETTLRTLFNKVDAIRIQFKETNKKEFSNIATIIDKKYTK